MSASQKIEYIFISQSILRFNEDLKKLLQIAPKMTSDECYDTMIKIENVKEKIRRLEKAMVNL